VRLVESKESGQLRMQRKDKLVHTSRRNLKNTIKSETALNASLKLLKISFGVNVFCEIYLYNLILNVSILLIHTKLKTIKEFQFKYTNMHIFF